MLVLKYVSIRFSLSIQMILRQPYPEAWSTLHSSKEEEYNTRTSTGT